MYREEEILTLTLDQVKEARVKNQRISFSWKGEDLEISEVTTREGLNRMPKGKRRISLTIEIG